MRIQLSCSDSCITLLLVSRNRLETKRCLTLEMKSDVCDSDLRDSVIRLDFNIDPLRSFKAAAVYHTFRTVTHNTVHPSHPG